MAEALSPGVQLEEINASNISPTVSNSITAFSGDFHKGPVGAYLLITNVQDLISNYGYPSNTNYNDWYQAYNFLQYGNKLLIARASNTNGTATVVSGATISGAGTAGDSTVTLADSTGIAVNSTIVFADGTPAADLDNVYSVIDNTANTITLDRVLVANVADLSQVYAYSASMNGAFEATSSSVQTTDTTLVVTGDEVAGSTLIEMASTTGLSVDDLVTFDIPTASTADSANIYKIESLVLDTSITLDKGLVVNINQTGGFDKVYSVVLGEATYNNIEYLPSLEVIENATDFETKEVSLPFIDSVNGKLKLIARDPGKWSDDLEIAIASPAAFNQTVPSFAFTGIALDDLFEYAPTGTEIGIVVKYSGDIVETWTVDFDETAKDFNNKSTYVENVINAQSQYIFAKDNTANATNMKDYLAVIGGVSASTTGSTISLFYGDDSTTGTDDVITGYDLFSNKEELDIDIIIGNELDSGASATALVDTRKDAITFIGAPYSTVVGQKSTVATSNILEWRAGTGSYVSDNVNYNDMFVVGAGNYKYQYDRYNDKYRWVNLAGDISGLRAQTSQNRASWWASAGLERGQIKNVTKLAFNPTQGQRDLLYKNGINPVVTFPGQGTVMWGQKTLLSNPSSFDRVNVRGLFNTLERSLSKMAKFQVMNFNDNFTRNRIVSMIKPYLSSVQAGRGIQDFLVICDESNNTQDIISRNQMIVDIYIKPTYAAEFITLRFTNAGTNSFAEIIGG